MRHALFTILMVLIFSSSPAYALSNGGFESGNLNGWSVDTPNGSTARVISSYSVTDIGGDTADYSPIEGNYFLSVTGQTADTHPARIYQLISLKEGDKIWGYAAFDSIDQINSFRNDSAAVYIRENLNDVPYSAPWFAAVAWNVAHHPYIEYIDEVGSFNHTDWMYWEWIAPHDGNYYIELAVSDSTDTHGHISNAVFDGIHIAPASTLPITFENFDLDAQDKRFGINLEDEYEGLDWAHDADTKIDTWGSFTVQDVGATDRNDSIGNTIHGAGDSENWLKVRASSVGKGATVTRPLDECFEFHSMRLYTQNHPAFINSITVTWRTLDGIDVSSAVLLTNDRWITITASDLGIGPGTLLKAMWFNGLNENPKASNFGLDDFTIKL